MTDCVVKSQKISVVFRMHKTIRIRYQLLADIARTEIQRWVGRGDETRKRSGIAERKNMWYLKDNGNVPLRADLTFIN